MNISLSIINDINPSDIRSLRELNESIICLKGIVNNTLPDKDIFVHTLSIANDPS